MPVSNGVVQSLIRNDPQHVNAQGCDHDLVVFDAQTTIHALFTVWDPASNFEQQAASHPLPKAQAMAAAFIIDVPVLVSAVPRCLAPGEWAQPVNASPSDPIVLEGNHRMLAVALRASWGMPLPRCIGVFVRRP